MRRRGRRLPCFRPALFISLALLELDALVLRNTFLDLASRPLALCGRYSVYTICNHTDRERLVIFESQRVHSHLPLGPTSSLAAFPRARLAQHHPVPIAVAKWTPLIRYHLKAKATVEAHVALLLRAQEDCEAELVRPLQRYTKGRRTDAVALAVGQYGHALKSCHCSGTLSQHLTLPTLKPCLCGKQPPHRANPMNKISCSKACTEHLPKSEAREVRHLKHEEHDKLIVVKDAIGAFRAQS